MNKLTVICFTDNGAEVVIRLRDALAKDFGIEVRGYAGYELSMPSLLSAHEKVSDIAGECFMQNEPLIFVGACGIAVRYTAPFIKDKAHDIPVLVVDETGRYVIPILSGHIGGANRLAHMIADVLGGEAVITTATDINETFAIDSFATEYGLTIRNRDRIKNVSKKVLKGEPIVIAVRDLDDTLRPDVVISDECKAADPLVLSPKRYVLGIGCKKGKTLSDIEPVVKDVLSEKGLEFEDIYAFASIDIKAEEEGLRDLSGKYRLPFFTFTADMLGRVSGDITRSDFVRDTVGVDNVCERAAILLSGGGRLVCKKRAKDGVTVAIAERRI